MLENLPSEVTLTEVGPRDGLQNTCKILDTDIKFELIRLLAQSGLKYIELTSFVSPKAVPQMSDSLSLCKRVHEELSDPQLCFPCLVPNSRGMDNALSAGAQEIAVLTACSETFNKKNIGTSISESLERIRNITKVAKEHNISVRAYISTVFGCPYEGKVSETQLMPLIDFFLELGVREISLGDTIGVATPLQVQRILRTIKHACSPKLLAMHFHDTRGMALSNILVSLEEEVQSFDSSLAGLGGCPYAPGASGNVGTEDLIYLLDSLGVKHGVDLDKLMQASHYILKKLNIQTSSRYLQSVST